MPKDIIFRPRTVVTFTKIKIKVGLLLKLTIENELKTKNIATKHTSILRVLASEANTILNLKRKGGRSQATNYGGRRESYLI